MRIAQVSPLYESVPPKFYGGTERVLSYLTEELVRQGHEVTLFASGDSVTNARLVSPCKRSLRLDESSIDPIAHHVYMLEEIVKSKDNYDIIHFHIDYIHFPICRHLSIPSVTTLHGRQDLPDLMGLYQEFNEAPLISISDEQRKPLPPCNWQGTVYHGLPADWYSFGKGRGGYLAFLGRISPEKGIECAVEIARKSGRTLKVAAKISVTDREYYENEVKHLMKLPFVEYIGEIGEAEKTEFLGNAAALLFPIDWPEPFGLVMIEAMACGTPVIAFNRGSVPEVIDEAVTGFICKNTGEAALAVERLDSFDREKCRSMFEKRFSAQRMASDYLEIYRNLAESGSGRVKRLSGVLR